MDSKRFKDGRGPANTTLKELIVRYRQEVGTEHPFGKNQAAVLATWEEEHGDRTLDEITDDYPTTFARNRRRARHLARRSGST